MPCQESKVEFGICLLLCEWVPLPRPAARPYGGAYIHYATTELCHNQEAREPEPAAQQDALHVLAHTTTTTTVPPSRNHGFCTSHRRRRRHRHREGELARPSRRRFQDLEGQGICRGARPQLQPPAAARQRPSSQAQPQWWQPRRKGQGVPPQPRTGRPPPAGTTCAAAAVTLH